MFALYNKIHLLKLMVGKIKNVLTCYLPTEEPEISTAEFNRPLWVQTDLEYEKFSLFVHSILIGWCI